MLIRTLNETKVEVLYRGGRFAYRVTVVVQVDGVPNTAHRCEEGRFVYRSAFRAHMAGVRRALALTEVVLAGA